MAHPGFDFTHKHAGLLLFVAAVLLLAFSLQRGMLGGEGQGRVLGERIENRVPYTCLLTEPTVTIVPIYYYPIT